MLTESKNNGPIKNGDTILEKVKASSCTNAIHPIWKTIHVAVVMAIACFFMWASASHFDSTEGKALLGMLLVMIVYAFGGDGLKILGRIFNLKNGR